MTTLYFLVVMLLGIGEGKQNSLRILPKYGEELRNKRKELQQKQRHEGRRRNMRDTRKEYDKERCDEITIPEGVQVA